MMSFCKDVRALGLRFAHFHLHFLFFPVITLSILRLLAFSILLDDSLLEALSLSTVVWEDQLRQATCQPNLAYLNSKDTF